MNKIEFDEREVQQLILQLHSAGYNNPQLRAARFSAQEMKEVGCTLLQLKQAGYTAGEVRGLFTVEEVVVKKVRGNYSRDTKKASNLYTMAELREGGYTVAELKASSTRTIFRPTAFKQGGFTAAEMREAQYTVAQCAQGGYTEQEVRAAGGHGNNFSLSSFWTWQ